MSTVKVAGPPDEAFVRHTFRYAGLRVNDAGRVANGKPWHVFVDGDGKEHWWALRRGAHLAIGGAYDLLIADHEGGQWRRGEPQYAGDVWDAAHPKRIEWAAADRIARTRLAGIKREQSAAKQDALREAIRPLLRVAKGYRLQADQDALAAYVIRQLHAAWANDGEPV